MQYSTAQYSAVQYSAVQYSAVQYSTVQCSTVQYSKIQCSTVQYSTVQYSAVQCSTVQHSTVQCSTAQHSTVQYSTVRYRAVRCGAMQSVHTFSSYVAKHNPYFVIIQPKIRTESSKISVVHFLSGPSPSTKLKNLNKVTDMSAVASPATLKASVISTVLEISTGSINRCGSTMAVALL